MKVGVMYKQGLIFEEEKGEKFKLEKKVRLIELFAGVGSQAMSLRDLGVDFEHYRVVEFDKYAIASYNAIHRTNFPTVDITTVKGADLGICDKNLYDYILTYSFPCTDLSVAGKMQGMAEGSGTRSSLLWEVKRLLEETDELPQVLLMENVSQVHSKANMPHFQKWLDFLTSKGYQNFYKDLNAKNYGVAQNRNRCFMVSILSKDFINFEFPAEQPLNKKIKDYLEETVNEKYYVNSEKAQKLIMDKDNLVLVKQATKEGFIKCKIGGVADLSFPESETRRGRVQNNGDVSPTITAESNCICKIENKYRIRKLTPHECWRLMSFTDEDFERAEKVNSNTQLYKQAGNSIVKNVLMAIFGEMI